MALEPAVEALPGHAYAGWGRKLVRRSGGDSSHNLFGIKANGWQGERATSGTHEYVNGVRRNETASFRAYNSVGESFADYVRLLKTSPRYQNALQAGQPRGCRCRPPAAAPAHRPWPDGL